MNIQFVTNNPMVRETYGKDYQVAYYDAPCREILAKVYALCLKGYRLLTHPLAGSVNPSDMPYRSVIMQKEKGEVDYESIVLIEKSLQAYDKFVPKKQEWTADILEDFRVLDTALMRSAVESMCRGRSKKKAKATVIKAKRQ